MIVYQLPAPSIVTLSTTMCRLTWYVPGGTYTLRWFLLANAIALSKASAESFRPNGSAPKSSTFAATTSTFGSPTSSESSRSTTVVAAPAGTERRTLSPALYALPRNRRCSSKKCIGRYGVGNVGTGSVNIGTHWHSVTHQSGCRIDALGSLENG